MDHSSSAHWSTERVLNSTRTCTGGDTTDDARSPASTVPARDEDARAMAKRDYELAKMQQTTPDKAGRAPSTPQPTLERNVQSREILTLALVEDTPSSTTSGQTSTTAKTAQTAKKTTKGKAKGKKTKGKKVMKKSKSKRPQKKTGTASIDKKRVAKPAEGEGNNGGGDPPSTPPSSPPSPAAPNVNVSPGPLVDKNAMNKKAMQAANNQSKNAAIKPEVTSPTPNANAATAMKPEVASPAPSPTSECGPSPSSEAVHSILNRAQTTDFPGDPSATVDLGEIPKRKKKGRDKVTHKLRMRFYRSLDSDLDRSMSPTTSSPLLCFYQLSSSTFFEPSLDQVGIYYILNIVIEHNIYYILLNIMHWLFDVTSGATTC